MFDSPGEVPWLARQLTCLSLSSCSTDNPCVTEKKDFTFQVLYNDCYTLECQVQNIKYDQNLYLRFKKGRAPYGSEVLKLPITL